MAVYLITIVLSTVFIIAGNRIASQGLISVEGSDDVPPPVKAKVTQILSREEDNAEDGAAGLKIIFEAKILSGDRKGDIVTSLQQTDAYSPVQLKEIAYGDTVLLYENTDEEIDTDWLLGEYVRTDALIWLGVLFCLGLLIFGRIKGVNTLISLVFTCLAVFIVFIPSVLAGQNIYAWSIIICVFIIVMTLLIVNGADRKSLAAGIGCFSGVAAAGILTLLMDSIIKLTGMVDEDSMYLYLLHEDNPIDLKAIIFAAIIIGAIGAIMDVSMSISSSLMELKNKVGAMSPKALFRSGITIGRDIMGTMANTLVLAYIGSSLSVTLLVVAYSNSMLALLNREMIVVEILNALVGSIGILLTIPLTSLICAVLYASGKKRRRRKPLLQIWRSSLPFLPPLKKMIFFPLTVFRMTRPITTGFDWISYAVFSCQSCKKVI